MNVVLPSYLFPQEPQDCSSSAQSTDSTIISNSGVSHVNGADAPRGQGGAKQAVQPADFQKIVEEHAMLFRKMTERSDEMQERITFLKEEANRKSAIAHENAMKVLDKEKRKRRLSDDEAESELLKKRKTSLHQEMAQKESRSELETKQIQAMIGNETVKLARFQQMLGIFAPPPPPPAPKQLIFQQPPPYFPHFAAPFAYPQPEHHPNQ
ncbi:unnamed protein product [Caenorhabditis sp. 36 PRJEB53466]|nr:unnamed protein product [Caenorhabditis sp. 36 PRJEB53466]